MSRNKFLESVSVIDTETTNLYPEKAEIVEIAGARYVDGTWDVSATLLGSLEPIPPEASAKNHISNRMIDGLPTFADSISKVVALTRWDDASYMVAHNAKYDQTVLAKAWLEANKEPWAERALDTNSWICTYRLSKHLLLDVDFGDLQYNLNYLRYRLDLPVPDDQGSHRAGIDTLTCAVLFEFLVDYAIATDKVRDGANLGRSINRLCWSPIPMATFPFGKHKGKPFSAIETDYYMWAMKNMDSLNEDASGYDPDLAAAVGAELETRL